MFRPLVFTALLVAGIAASASVVAAADDPAALVVVNGATLTQADVDQRLSTRMARFEGMPDSSRPQIEAQLRKMIEEEFIARTLLTAEAKRLELTVSDNEVDAMVEEAKANLPAGMTLADILKAEQLDEAGLREEIRQQLTMKKVIDNAVQAEAEPTEEEIKAFYEDNVEKMKVPESVRARHILIKVDAGADDAEKEAKAKEAAAIRKQLLEGADFATLAKEKSACPSSQSGGDLGVFPRGQMVQPFEAAAFAQQVGEIGEVVETDFGYHIILVEERNEAEDRGLEEAREEIAQFLASRGVNESRQAYMEQLREKATIEYPAKAAN
jgi:peptidyl-prolyl cis-trans isomerase C